MEQAHTPPMALSKPRFCFVFFFVIGLALVVLTAMVGRDQCRSVVVMRAFDGGEEWRGARGRAGGGPRRRHGVAGRGAGPRTARGRGGIAL